MSFRGRVIRLSVIVGIIALLLLGASSFGSRIGLLNFQIALGMFALSGMVGGAAMLLALVALIWTLFSEHKGGMILALLVLIAAGGIVSVPAYYVVMGTSGKYPPIHDITTDIQNPPEFVDVLKRRGKSANPVAYEGQVVPNGPGMGDLVGQSVAEVQQKFYPDIKPVILDLSKDDAYWAALGAMPSDWEIVASDIDGGHIEATATTKWFGFKDDVVIRLTPEGEDKTRLDVRSSSRVGVGDLGANAKRVRQYLKAVHEAPHPSE